MASKYPHIAKANKYARNIVTGKIDSCWQIKKVCQNHLDDLKKSKEKSYPYKFDKDKGEKVCVFAGLLKHIKGKWMGQRIVLEPWQCFAFAVLIGWVWKASNFRRYREFLFLIPRKNGKSMMGAILCLFITFVDGEKGAEGYAAANSEDQAYKVFKPAWQMVDKSPFMQNKFGISLGGTVENPGNIYSLHSNSSLETVIGKPRDGASPTIWMLDEFHESKTPVSYDAGKTGTGAREQPLLGVISTTGTNTAVPLYFLQEKAENILKGLIERDNIFSMIFTIDPEDDWENFSCWIKANPNIDVSVFKDYLKDQWKDTVENSTKQNINKCKHLNIWSNAGDSWLNMLEWEKAGNPELNIEDFWDEPCNLGLDLSSKLDVASAMRLFKKKIDGVVHYYLFSKHFIPESQTKEKENEHFLKWSREGFLESTIGKRIDFETIEEWLYVQAKLFDLSGEDNGGGSVCNDPWESQPTVARLEKRKISVVEISQVPNMLTGPMKEIEASVKDSTFHHDGNPLTNWMFGNAIRKDHSKGRQSIDKEDKKKKIDGAAATINAMARSMFDIDGSSGKSRYENLDEEVKVYGKI